ncbi:Lin1 family protein [Coccidioides posadasii C735 delta SOWgp]|uniref:Lin1 family protein n=1 Tax=Coccidioides posadasii (strain C735) TaxID=222929 RepID=C5P7Q0_COCP7|nr:Lin1 family protein [Coccidioides posadasii C735 delta SOWgp]EER27450.1 Lin1 family protein [Coccidioides posadasii C735 delta SOWgp]|eukprot:XP_003069595.1 Lin1 family protein [Coccidioides posadasii C735 delta SOWgp]
MLSNTIARPKRAADDYARQHHNEYDPDGPSSTKKARFDLRNPSTLIPDATEEDAVLDADEIGRRGQRIKRNAVNIDGYDSDSENENFDARAEARVKSSKAENDVDEDDMFAEVEEEMGVPEDDLGKAKKQVRFLNDDEIEGQVNNSRSGGKVRLDNIDPKGKGKGKAVEEDSSESDTDEEGRADLGGVDKELGAGGKKTHAPLLDAFNMRSEQEEGRFDEAGNYIRKAADPDAIHDSWLEGLSKKDMKKARAAAEKREEERRQKSIADASILTGDVLKTLIASLHRGETILDALARLGKGQKRRPKWQNKQKNKHKKSNGAAEDVEMTEESPADAARKRAIEEITGAADILLSRGQTEIYDTEREMLTRQYRRETGEEWVDPPRTESAEPEDNENAMWEFRWSDARDGGATHGPYEKTTMESWNNAGYFGDGGVEFRKVGCTTWNSAAVFSQ